MTYSLLTTLVLLGAEPSHAEAVKKYLTGSTEERAELVHPEVSKAVTKLVDAGPICARGAARPSTEPRVTALPTGRLVVDWKAGAGRGAHRESFAVKDGKVLDVQPLVDAAEHALREGDHQPAMQHAQEVLKLDGENDEALGLMARVVARLGDGKRADTLVAQARTANPEGIAWRLAAYDVALQLGRASDVDPAREACFTAVRDAQLDDARCFLVHAWKTRGGMNQSVLRQELEEALGRAPDDGRLRAVLGVVLAGMARTGRSSDAALLAQAQLRLKEGLVCPEALDEQARGAALHALASTSLELRNGPCAGPAEAAVLADPTQPEYRRTLLACAEATVLLANRMNRRALRDSGVDLQIEGQAITMSLMRDKATLGGRRLPAFEAYARCRASVKQQDGRLEITLSDLAAPRRKTREEDAVAAAFMVHQVYAALYGDELPPIINVRTRYAGDGKDYIFPMPDKVKPAWNTALPPDKDIAEMARQVVVRGAE